MVQPLDAIIMELLSDNWLEVGRAIRKLIPHGESASAALPVLFELTRHDKAPVASDSSSLIKRLGEHAVPFLREQIVDQCPDHRAMAIGLLTEAGVRRATSTRLVEQVLEDRREELPAWGTDPEELIALFRAALDDESLTVRFKAAGTLEEFGRHIPETVQVFVDALQNGTPYQQNWAALHLGRIGPLAIAATHALEVAAKSECKYTALAASNALERIGGST